MSDFDFGDPIKPPSSTNKQWDSDRQQSANGHYGPGSPPSNGSRSGSYQRKDYSGQRNTGETYVPKEIVAAETIYTPVVFSSNEDLTPDDLGSNLATLIEALKISKVVVRIAQLNPFYTVFKNEGIPLEAFIPWDGFADTVKVDQTVSNQAVACLLYRNPRAVEDKPGVKKIKALMYNLLLGKFVNSRALLTILYTKDGINAKTSNAKTSGFAYLTLETSHDLQIPYYNIGSPDQLTNLIKRLNSFPYIMRATN